MRIGARLNVAQLPVACVSDLLHLGLVDFAQLSDAQLEQIACSGPVDMSASRRERRPTRFLNRRLALFEANRTGINSEPTTTNQPTCSGATRLRCNLSVRIHVMV
jgi:hypothetical protein